MSDGENRNTHPAVAALAIILAVALAAFIVLPMFAPWPFGPPPARRAHCLNNIRQVGLAMLVHAQDHHDRYPETFGVLLKEGYLTSTKVFVCPSSGTKVPEDFPSENFKDVDLNVLDRVDEWSDYVMVHGVTPDSPRDFILLHEKRGSHNGEGGNCFFNDGVTQWLSEAEFREQMKAQQARMREMREKVVE